MSVRAHYATGTIKLKTYTGGTALALERAAEVVDDNAGSPRCEKCGICFAETATGTGDNDDLAVVPQLLSHRESEVWSRGGGEKGRDQRSMGKQQLQSSQLASTSKNVKLAQWQQAG